MRRAHATGLMLGLMLLLWLSPSRAFAMLHPQQGRFMQRDPRGYVDGASGYEYERGRPRCGTDAMGEVFQLDATPEIEAARIPEQPGAYGIVRQHLDSDIRCEDLSGKGTFCSVLKLDIKLAVYMKIRKGLDDYTKRRSIDHEYTHYRTWVDGFWPQVKRLEWFDGKRFRSCTRCEAARDKLSAHLWAFYGRALEHSLSFDPFNAASRQELVQYGDRPFRERLVTDDIPLDE